MKNLILIVVCVVFFYSCNSSVQSPKEHYSSRERTFSLQRDSIVKKIIEFTSQSKVPSKVVGVTSGLVLIEEEWNDDQSEKYSDIDPEKMDAGVISSKARLLVSLNPDSSGEKVAVKTFITSTISICNYHWKQIDRTSKEISCNSSGVREKEILDFLGRRD